MPQIQGVNREQITFSNLESQISKDNEIRFIDAFVDKLDLKQLGIQSLVQSEKKKQEELPLKMHCFKIVFVCLFEWIKEQPQIRERNSKECRIAVVAQRTMSQLSFHCRLPKDQCSGIKILFKLFVLF